MTEIEKIREEARQRIIDLREINSDAKVVSNELYDGIHYVAVQANTPVWDHAYKVALTAAYMFEVEGVRR